MDELFVVIYKDIIYYFIYHSINDYNIYSGVENNTSFILM